MAKMTREEAKEYVAGDTFLYVTLEDGTTLKINKEGEILEESPYKGLGKKPVKTLAEITSREDFDKYMKAHVDKRKMIGGESKDLHRVFCDLCGDHALKGTDKIPNRVYQGLLTLIPLVEYRNIIITSTSDLALGMGVGEKNLRRSIKRLFPYVRIIEGMEHGFIQLQIHPAFIWKYEYREYSHSRGEALKYWQFPSV